MSLINAAQWILRATRDVAVVDVVVVVVVQLVAWKFCVVKVLVLCILNRAVTTTCATHTLTVNFISPHLPLSALLRFVKAWKSSLIFVTVQCNCIECIYINYIECPVRVQSSPVGSVPAVPGQNECALNTRFVGPACLATFSHIALSDQQKG